MSRRPRVRLSASVHAKPWTLRNHQSSPYETARPSSRSSSASLRSRRPAEADQAEDTAREREHEAVARKLAQVLEDVGERQLHIRFKGERERLDVAALAPHGGGRE